MPRSPIQGSQGYAKATPRRGRPDSNPKAKAEIKAEDEPTPRQSTSIAKARPSIAKAEQGKMTRRGSPRPRRGQSRARQGKAKAAQGQGVAKAEHAKARPRQPSPAKAAQSSQGKGVVTPWK
ncbi:hypothetical protein RHMOL_Rhmol05G0239400 [Rhododendron molle]|uniref:Uncharacterized protein n=2 Tax=Rhododendron molle TaxID=49168 RepID=A0ACC0NTR9_RHOML|nr:hypothetical protein RHMOL_Rhmol05G0239400 [Rhododendron molle]KAI8556264.1 hypothetical protein RHMOL_Rhmol05G0239400 [Rhododendron molle]